MTTKISIFRSSIPTPFVLAGSALAVVLVACDPADLADLEPRAREQVDIYESRNPREDIRRQLAFLRGKAEEAERTGRPMPADMRRALGKVERLVANIEEEERVERERGLLGDSLAASQRICPAEVSPRIQASSAAGIYANSGIAHYSGGSWQDTEVNADHFMDLNLRVTGGRPNGKQRWRYCHPSFRASLAEGAVHKHEGGRVCVDLLTHHSAVNSTGSDNTSTRDHECVQVPPKDGSSGGNGGGEPPPNDGSDDCKTGKYSSQGLCCDEFYTVKNVDVCIVQGYQGSAPFLKDDSPPLATYPEREADGPSTSKMP